MIRLHDKRVHSTFILMTVLSLLLVDFPHGASANDDRPPDWFTNGVVAALLDPTDGVTAAATSLTNAGGALAQIGASDAMAKNAAEITQRLLQGLSDSRGDGLANTIHALGAINSVKTSRIAVDRLLFIAKSNAPAKALVATASAFAQMSSASGDQHK